MKQPLLLSLGIFFSLSGLNAQNGTDKNWAVNVEPRKVFIENKGQFHIHNSTEKVLFAVDMGSPENVYFTSTGVTYSYLKRWRDMPDEKEMERERNRGFKSVEEYKAFEEKEHKMKFATDAVSFHWKNANPNATLVASKKAADYFGYSFHDIDGQVKHISDIAAFEKITYKNLYPNIDVEYVFHPKEGLKYSIILHPGADISQVQMEYSENVKMDADGNVLIKTKFGNITDHAPLTFYASNHSQIITSSFVKNGSTVSFSLGDYDHSKEVIIDPWTQSPTFGSTTWHTVWECEKDGSGNVYIIGGGASQIAGSQMALKKYNSTGTLQWTYITPYDTSNVWLGTFATDNLGASYVTAGSVAQIQKVSTAGAVVWNNTNPGGILSSAEFWNIVFNCDQSKLVIGGTGGPLLSLHAVIYNVDVNTGNITNQVTVAIGPMAGIPPNIQEVRSISSCPNGKYYFMCHDTIGSINQNFSLCPNGSSTLNKINNGIDFGYKCEDYRFDNSGIMSVRADANFLYVNKGDQIQKRSLTTLAVLASATIPGGALNTVFLSGKNVSNSGIDIDNCGNIYVGSKNQVVKFDANLNQLATYATAFNVYDVHVSTSGDIIACGSTGTSSTNNRTGSVQQFAASACVPIALTCCDATICNPGSFCQGDPATNLVAATPGGTWSGPGITNASAGTFNPSVAGVGIHTVTYTLPCGSESISVEVLSCQALSVCAEANGNITVTGTGPFTWYHQTTTTPCVSGLGNYCGLFTTAGAPVTTWTSFTTGSTINPSLGSYPMYVINSGGDSAYIANFASLPSCNSCAMTGSIASQTNVSCFGTATGSATASQSGGSGGITYSWAPSGGNAATASNLTAGTYTCTITAGSCTATATVTITQPSSAVSATSTSSNPLNCSTSTTTLTATPSGGTGPYTYSWSSGSTSQTAVVSVAANYTCTVTDASGCVTTTTVTAVGGSLPTTSVTATTNNTCFGNTNGSATVAATGTGPFTYSWSPSGGSGATASNLAAGTYTCTVTDATGCANTQTVTITQGAAILTPTSSVNATCGVNNGSATVNASGGTGTLTYSWTPGGQSTSTISGQAAGTYTCTVTDASACTASVTVIITSNGGATVSLASQSNILCNGAATGAATVTATGGTGTLTYSWTPSGGTAATASGLTAGTYTCAVTDGSGCVQTQTVSITEPSAITTTTASANSNCGASTGSATVTPSGGAGGFTYNWAPSGGSAATASSLAAGTYTCTITDANACTQTVSVVVNNNGGPTAVASSNGTICAGANVNLTSSGGVSYSWTGPNSFTSTNQNPSITGATTAASGVYTVTVTDAGGCTNSATVTVTVNAAPVATASVTTATICAGSSINLNASGGGTYAWAGPNSFTSTSQNPTITAATTAASGTYTVVVAIGSCTATATTSVTVNPAPTATSTGNGPVCAGNTINLTSSGGGTYSWSGPGGFTSSLQNPTISGATSANSGTYTVTVTVGTCTASSTVLVAVGNNSASSVNAAICTGDTYTLPDNSVVSTAGTYVDTIATSLGCDSIVTTVLTVSAPPNVSVNVTANDTITLGQTATLTAAGATTYIWSTGSTGNSIIVNPTATGTYVYCVVGTNGSGCLDSVCQNIFVKKLDCGEIFLPSAFSPNGDGANDALCIYGSACITELEFRIFDRWGEKVFESTDPEFCWDGKFKGKELNSAVFGYYLNATLNTGDPVVLKGNITLVK